MPQVVEKLDKVLARKGKEQVIEQVAYVWFNRFCALRFMDANDYIMSCRGSYPTQWIQHFVLKH
ncbi:hypothetical protein SPONL_2031 [uncultured Candidatus Thioglobus sp.]|nr:hypothetical protein SPONL_2031 [uncultured Candidatus Thioglobus sp.]